ncbi:hypothetical protein Tco_0255282 [Tanacetum coccineum]
MFTLHTRGNLSMLSWIDAVEFSEDLLGSAGGGSVVMGSAGGGFSGYGEVVVIIPGDIPGEHVARER